MNSMNILFNGIMNISYIQLINKLLADYTIETNVIIIGDSKLIRENIINTNNCNLTILNHNKFKFLNQIEKYVESDKRITTFTLNDSMIRDSFIRIFPHYWDNKKIDSFILRLSNYWVNSLAKNNIEVIMNLSAIPHFPSDLVIEKISLLYKIKIINFWHTGVSNYVHVAGSVFENFLEPIDIPPLTLIDAYEYDNLIRTVNEMKSIRDITITTPKSYTTKRKIKLYNKFTHLIFHFKNYGFIRALFRFILNKSYKRFNYFSKLKDKKVTVLPEKFIYFPLHYQPEATTLPLAGVFRNQILIIDSLNKLFPDLIIIIKEHPVQENFGRSKEFYSSLIDNNKVLIIDDSIYSSQYLIEKCLFVVSANGSVIFESFLLNKASLMYGNNIYRLLPNVIHINDVIVSSEPFSEENWKSIHFSMNNKFFEFLKKFGLKSSLLLKNNNVDIKEIELNYNAIRKILLQII